MTEPSPPSSLAARLPRRLRRLRDVLRPLPGRRLVRELRPAHVGKLAVQLPGGVRDPLFEGLLRRIDSSPFHVDNAVAVYIRGEDTFAAMLADIAGATQEVLLEAYIFRDDATGRVLNDACCDAARRGVRVKVLADAFGSLSTKSGFWTCLREAGCEARLFHPLLPYFWAQAIRDHRKILVVDRRVAYTGGMNIGDEWGQSASWLFGGRSRRQENPGEHPWRDTHARVEGSAAWELAAVFSEGWERAGGEPMTVEPLVAEPHGSARVLVLDSRPGRGHVESASVIAATIAAARHRVWITNAYFAPHRRAIGALIAAARRGVDVRLLLPGRTDAPLVRHAGHGAFHRLLTGGVKVHEYRTAILHAKTLLADDYVAIVGSSNLDFRSFQFNGECNLVILDDPTGARLARTYEADLREADEIDLAAWRRRPLLHRIGDELAERLSPVL